MNMCNISEDAFQRQVAEIHEISNKLKDNWEFYSVEKSIYLRKKENVLLDLKREPNETYSEKGPEEFEEKKVCREATNCEEGIDSACLVEDLSIDKVSTFFINKYSFNALTKYRRLLHRECFASSLLNRLHQVYEKMLYLSKKKKKKKTTCHR